MMYTCEKCKANFNTEEAARRHEDNCRIWSIVKLVELNLNLMYDAEGRVSNISFVWPHHDASPLLNQSLNSSIDRDVFIGCHCSEKGLPYTFFWKAYASNNPKATREAKQKICESFRCFKNSIDQVWEDFLDEPLFDEEERRA